MSGLDHLLEMDVYREYRRRIDVRAVLDHYGAQHCTEQMNRDGTIEIIHSCLLDRVEPHHSNGDQNPSAAANIDKGTYVCYSSGLGCDIVHLVMKLEGKESFAEAMGMVGNFLTGATQDVAVLQKELDRVFATTPAYALNLPSYDLRILQQWLTPHPYWGQRGINEETQQLLHLGYDAHEQRVVFPHYVQGKLVGWQKRVIPGVTRPEFPKYRNSPGFPKSETLYAYDLCDPGGPVLVVESPMSVAHAYSIGLRNVTATFGSKTSEHQARLLRGHSRVIVWFDQDPAGLEGERQLVERLYRHTEVLVVPPDEGRDLGDCDLAEVEMKWGQVIPAALRLAWYAPRKKKRSR